MTGKPLIVHLLYRLDTGGMERIAVSLINATRHRYRHAVIALAGVGPLRIEIENSVVACLSLDKKPGKDWPHYFRVWRALRALKPDLVQTYNIGTLDLAPVVKLAGVRRLVHAEHGRDVSDPRGDNAKNQRLRRWMAPFITRYVAVSPDLHAWLVDTVGIASSKVMYISNGIDLAPYADTCRKSGSRRCEVLRDFAPAGTRLIGNVARLDKVKDHAGLLLAFKHLREQIGRVDCRLVIAGDGSQREALARQVQELGLTDTVRLLGNRRDVPALLDSCDVFVLSSIAEGMPVTLLEAMAAGLPVVATDVGGVASVVERGVTGTLIPPRDRVALAEALGVYVADEGLRRQHGDAGRARVRARFGLGSMTSAYMALYDELLGHRADATQQGVVPGMAGREEH
ncbi:MAG: TIGR03088 family PEP-CTERM/XrtA system glycosyltransferase [Rhodanobacteraceae bacterium]